jgi:hypothetical protein
LEIDLEKIDMADEKPRDDAGDFLVALLKLGNQAVKDHGDSLEKRKVSIAPDVGDRHWKVVYGKIPPPGKVIAGGDIVVVIDAQKMAVEGVRKSR